MATEPKLSLADLCEAYFDAYGKEPSVHTGNTPIMRMLGDLTGMTAGDVSLALAAERDNRNAALQAGNEYWQGHRELTPTALIEAFRAGAAWERRRGNR